MKEEVQKYISAYNNFDIETMISLMHNDCIFESKHNNIVELRTKGKPDFRQICNLSKNNYKYRKQIIENFNEYDNNVEVKLYFKATLAIDIPDLGKKDEQISFETKSIFEFKNGLIYKLTHFD